MVSEVQGAESVINSREFDWTTVDSVDKALAIIEQAGLQVEAVEDYTSDGFKLVEKDSLIGVPLLILGWRTGPGDFGDFVTVRAMITDGNDKGKRVIFNDGSTGIMGILDEIEKKKELMSYKEWVFNPMRARKGLRRSSYDIEVDGKVKKAHTFYFN